MQRKYYVLLIFEGFYYQVSIGWKSSNPELVAVSSEGTVSAKGSAGTAVVAAYSIADESVRAECQVTVEPYYGEHIKVTSVKLKAPEEVFWCGNTYRLAADILPQNAANQAVAFTSSNPKVASVSVSGQLTALTAGTAEITVRSIASGLTDTIEIEIRDADREAADAVIRKIESIGEVTLESEAAIKSARQSYDSLTAAQKALVGAGLLEVLEDAEQALADLKKEEADKNAANVAAQKISAIGAVTLESEAAIQEARAAYEALTAIQKELVGAGLLKVLEDAEQALADLKKEEADQNAANAVAQKINAIGTVTLEKEAQIQEARAAYEGLTASQKTLVGQDTLDTLTKAESAWKTLKEEADRKEEDQAAADKVKALIQAIGDVTLESKEKIAEARAAYEGLPEGQKALLGDALQLLLYVEEKLAALETAAKPVPITAPKIQVKSSIAEKAAGRVKISFAKPQAGQKIAVYRKVGSKITLIGETTTAGSLYDSSPASGKKASYYAKAIALDQTKYKDSPNSTEVSISLPANTKKAAAKQDGAKCVKVTWKKVKGASAYYVYRSTQKDKGFVKVARVSASKLAYLDKKAKVNQKYYYKVVSGTKGKYSSGKVSNAVSVAALPANTKKVTAKQDGKQRVKVTWKKAKGATGYDIYRSTKKNKGFVKIAKVSASKQAYVDTKVKSNKTYYYKVVTKKKALGSSGKISNAVKVKK